VNKDIQLKTGNKNKPEASIAEATLTEEMSNFTTKYYDDNIPTRHNLVLRYNAANHEEVSKLSIFVELRSKSSGTKRMTIKGSEWDLIHSYVLNNMEEVKPYIK
jgi:hypothetical protein